MTPLEEMERLRAEFLGMVSHELRTPLTSVKGSVANLLDPAASLDPAGVVQFHRIIDAQSDRMRDLISDLLDVARIQTGGLPVSPGPGELAGLMDEAKSTYLSGGGRNNIRIEIPPGLPAVMADGRRIVQVIGNLLSNASRHSPESSVIRVAAELDGLYVRDSVIDAGRGIPADRLPHLFRKFSRFDVEDQGGDTGLGLAICKGIVEAHGGASGPRATGPAWAPASPSPFRPTARRIPSSGRGRPVPALATGVPPRSRPGFSRWTTTPRRSGTSGTFSPRRATR